MALYVVVMSLPEQEMGKQTGRGVQHQNFMEP